MDNMKQFKESFREDVITASENEAVVKLAQLMDKHQIGSIVIMNGDKIVGIATERDIIGKVVAKGASLDSVIAKDIMTKDVVTAEVKEGVNKIFNILRKSPFRHLPIVDNEKLVGMVSKRDILYLMDPK